MKEKGNTKSLLTLWKESKQKQTLSNRITIAPEGAEIPASSGQKRLWFLHQLYPENPVYNYSEWYHFKGGLDADILKESVQQLYRSHSILRTYFVFEDDILYQRLDTSKEVPIREYDLSTLSATDKAVRKDELLLDDAGRSFDLDRPPLTRVILLKLDDEEWILMVTMHHIITDKWSMGIIREQLAGTYNSLRTDPTFHMQAPEIQFGDYAYWEQMRKVDTEQLEYWKKKLSGEIPELKLPVDHLPNIENTFKGDRYIQPLESSLSSEVIALAARMDTTPYVLMLAVYYLMLYRYSGQTDILIGTPISNRQEKVLEDLIGFFDETLVLRTGFETDTTFTELLHKVKRTTLEAFANKDVSFDILVKELKAERSMGVNPFFRSMFIYHAVPETPVFDPDVELTYSYLNSGVTKFDLTLFIGNDNGELSASFEYSTDLFEASTIEQLHKHYKLLLEGIVKDPSRSLDAYLMLTPAEKQLLLPGSATQEHEFSSYKGIHKVIEKQAQMNPTGLAVVYKDHSLTYGELDARAEQIAGNILRYTHGKHTVIGLALDRSLDMIAGLLGILKSGCAYLPLDAEYPYERLDFMVSDADAALVLVDDRSKSLFTSSNRKVLNLDNLSFSDVLAGSKPETKPGHLAYIIYTSGSTGRPKGVPISHENILASTAGRLSFYPDTPKAFLLMSSISFDSAKAGIFWTLCSGGSLILSEKRIEQEPQKLLAIIRQHKVSHSLMLPSLYQVLLEFGSAEDFKPLTTMIVAGEACPPSLVKNHYKVQPEVFLYNEYGPTEGTVWCTAHRVEERDAQGSVPIGKPVAGMQTWILDPKMRPVPLGMPGQLFISGPGLSTGYLNRPELTKDTFMNAKLGDLEVRLYATGDRVRYRRDGTLEFKGRTDTQIKIRGYRVELESIENALKDIPHCLDAKVVWDRESKMVRAAIVSDLKIERDTIKDNLGNRLPAYMVPAQLQQVKALPHLPNGKVDSAQLCIELRQLEMRHDTTQEEPQNEVQVQLQSIWEEVLQRSPVGIHNNFFEIGGDSISSIQIIAKARGKGLVLEPNQLFEYQTIAELSPFVRTMEAGEETDENWDSPLPLSPIQHWFFDNFRSAPHYWNQIVELHAGHHLTYPKVKKCIEALVRYHEALRLAFINVEGEWTARVLPESDIACCFHLKLPQTSEKEDQDKSAIKLLKEHQEKSKLEDGNLFRLIYMESGPDDPKRIFLIAHHLVIDMVSWNSIFDDIRQGIQQLEEGRPLHFKPKTDSIIQHGRFIFELIEKRQREEIEYWKAQLIDRLELPYDKAAAQKPFKEENVSNIDLEINEPGFKEAFISAHSAYNTNAEDLLLAALFLTLHPYSTNKSIPIYLERHGRAIESKSANFTNTIGWFTSFFPFCLSASEPGITGLLVKEIKEQLRGIPADGMGFGVLKYVLKNSELQVKDSQMPDVVFNYLGQALTIDTNQEYNFRFLGHSHRDPQSERAYALEINAFMSDTGVLIRFTYDSLSFKQTTIQSLTAAFQTHLDSIIRHCQQKDVTSFTPSDFPEADISQDDLDSLLEQLGG